MYSMPIPKRVAILTMSAAGLAMLAAPTSMTPARLVWNASPSAPTGLYSIEHGVWRVGDRVAVKPSMVLAQDLDRRNILPKGKLLLKRVAAGQGDIVCREGQSVTVNANLVATARAASSAGAPLPGWRGCQTLGSSDVLLLGDTAASYDGRYFGVTSADEILGRASLLIAL